MENYMELLQSSVSTLPRTAVRTIKRLQSLGILTYDDLLNYYPVRYDDYRKTIPAISIKDGELVTIRGKIVSFKQVTTRKRMTMQKVIINDGFLDIELFWYNQAYLNNILPVGTILSVSGVAERTLLNVSMKPSEYEVLKNIDDRSIHTGRLVPVYAQTYGLSSKTIRDKILYLLSKLEDISENELELIPNVLLSENNLISYKNALNMIHFPKDTIEVENARKRLAFNELFIRLLSSHLIKSEWKKGKISKRILITRDILNKINEFISSLPFKLTTSQKRSLNEVLEDLNKPVPMNRFLQGDVGSGKTIVAMCAAFATCLNGLQTLIMAPTEILAQQHYKTLSHLGSKIGINIALQTSSHKDIKKTKATNNYQIVIGTQALLSKDFKMDNVGLIVIDEQHRFGVRQRSLLKNKGINPHLLTMTATPIPRTVSLTLYSELDVSVIDEMPKGRKIIKTYVTPEQKRANGYEWIRNQISNDNVQAYVVCPLIENSDSETMTSVRAATDVFKHLKDDIFPNFSLALLHGKLKSREKKQIMEDFNAKKYQILVSTSVVEVGIDVSNATIMIIEGAERFGLAQLHQLRGRIGRGEKQSYCFLFTSNHYQQKQKRLQFFASTNSGLALAEYDLKNRGPGELYGTKQHGYSDLKIADIMDTKSVNIAQTAVKEFTDNYKLDDHEYLKSCIESYQINQIARD